MTPIILTSKSFTLTQDQTLELPSDDFKNPFRAPMWIDEIRVRVTDSSGSPLADETTLSALRLDLKLGKTPLTSGYVPIGNFGKRLPNYPTAAFGADPTPAFMVWRLPKPLFVPGSEYLVPRFQYDGESGRLRNETLPTITPHLTYVGRVFDSSKEEPRVINVPWVTHWPVRSLIQTTDEQIFDSSEADLNHPFDAPLRVQRFIGRYFNHVAGIGRLDEYYAQVQTIRGVDSQGNILIRDETPFGHVFEHASKAWTVGSMLPSKGFYLMQMKFPAAAEDPGGTFYEFANVSMVGYREVEMR